MQALARASQRVARQAGSVGQVREMSAMGTVDIATELKEMKKWKVVTFACIPLCIAMGVYSLSKHHEHHESTHYPYQKIRSKEFPWGQCDLFDSECKKGAAH